MYKMKCIKDGTEFQLPSTDQEFQSGKFHDQVELCQAHIEESPDCRFKEVERCKQL